MTESTTRHRLGIALVAALTALTAITAAAPTRHDGGNSVDVVVREAHPATRTAENLVERMGGTITRSLSIIGGFAATVPAAAVPTLESDGAIAAVTPDAGVQLTDDKWEDEESGTFNGYGVYHAAYTMWVKSFWKTGYHGQGVDVALIDSGVLPVEGLTWNGKVVNGPDLSFESQNPDFRYLDTYGHGTHMAGIIAGRDDNITYDPASYYSKYFDETPGFIGVAPGSRIVSVKVADHTGASDISQVIAAIDWVVQHRTDNGLNIRVLNLSFGTDTSQPYVLDPVAFAVEQAWQNGIVVVVAAGNDGNTAALRNPAYDPFVIAVGATDSNGTYSTSNDTIAQFSNCGTSSRGVDIVAPGTSIRSLRAPGSSADSDHPSARVGNRFFKGSGTSQAAAMVSGAAALVISQRPQATPDQVKALLMDNAANLASASGLCEGAGIVKMSGVKYASTPSVTQNYVQSSGKGSIEASRGSDHLEADGVVLSGEQDIFGQDWNGKSWSKAADQGSSWSSGNWNGSSWSGSSWSGSSWSGSSWSGSSWSGSSWSGSSWSGSSWSARTWTGSSWSGSSWSASAWTGSSWSGANWANASYGAAVQGLSWD